MKKNKILIYTLILTIVASIYPAYSAYKNWQESRYRKTFWETVYIIGTDMDLMSTFLSKGFRAPLMTSMGGELESSVKTVEDGRQIIKIGMQDLGRNTPNKYKEAFNLLLEIYSEYDQFYNEFRSDRSGALSYWETNSKINRIGGLLSKLEFIIPMDKQIMHNLATVKEQAQQHFERQSQENRNMGNGSYVPYEPYHQ